MKYNKKSLLLSAVTLGLLTSNLEPIVVNASNEADVNEDEPTANEKTTDSISKEKGTIYHIVRPGNTVFNISKQYKISQKELTAWNNISNNVIYLDQILSVNGVNVYDEIIEETHTFYSTAQFIDYIAPIALEVAEKYELYPSVMIAQATLETGGGTSELARIANNYFGIKGAYEGNSIYKLSPEEINGTIINESSRFRVYPTLYESFVDNGKRLRLGPNKNSDDKPWDPNHYKGTWVENTESYYDATKALVDAGYATDSSYATKLNAIIEEYDLIEYDKKIYDHIDESITGPVTPDTSGQAATPSPDKNQDAEGQVFLDAATVLPSISSIAKMDEEQLAKTETRLANARSLYDALSSSAKKDKEVIRWESYLTDKEEAVDLALNNDDAAKEEAEREAAEKEAAEKEAVEAQANAEAAFVKAVGALPNVSNIATMNESALAQAADEMAQVRALYDNLPNDIKDSAQVSKWAGYLVEKETALSLREVSLSSNIQEAFIDAVVGLPNVNQITQMSAEEVAETQAEAQSARALYSSLSSAEKADEKVARWAGYLAEKETALSEREAALSTNSSEDFVNAVSKAPNVSQITQMDHDELAAAEVKLQAARDLYNSLSSSDKANATVSRWEGHLSAKENALFERKVSMPTDAAKAFVNAVSKLPNVSQIIAMNSAEKSAAEADMKEVRAQYEGLSSTEKANETVARWAGHLRDKEKALTTRPGEVFVSEALGLPSVSSINKMTQSELNRVEAELAKARTLYDNLPASEKRDADVAKWEGYLADKEAAVANIYSSADAFVHQVSRIPTVAVLRSMSGSQLENAQVQLKEARKAYNALPQASKRFSDVKRWEGYLTDKENATKSTTSSVRLNYDIKYAVESGDTFNSIAEKFKVDVDRLIARNPKLDPRNLKSGQTVYVPNALARPMDHPEARDGKHVIYLDAGHGGRESGATYSGTTEKQLNLNIARKLTNKLESMGYTVVNSRTTDKQISLIDRSKSANASNGDVFVSLHHNAMGVANSSVSGIETFYYEYERDYPSKINQKYHNYGERIASSAYLAHLVQDNLVDATGANDRGVKTNTFAVLRETSIPAILVEFGFMDNSTELAKLKTNSYQNKMVNAVAQAIDTYFKTLYK